MPVTGENIFVLTRLPQNAPTLVVVRGGFGPQGAAGGGGGGSNWTNRGTWSSATAYAINDVVLHNGSSYVALAASTNVTPGTAPATWQLVAQKGDTGAQGPQGLQGIQGNQGNPGTDGNDGWTPILAVVSDGERRVHQVVDWTGGEGTKPTTGQYVGATGLVALIANAVDIRGATGAQGAQGIQGIQGAQGLQGPQGIQGAQGNTGPAAWTPVAAWAASTSYVVGPPASVVTYQGETYVCTTAHTSTALFDASKWSKVAARGAATRILVFKLKLADGSVLSTGLWDDEILIPFGLTPLSWKVQLPNETGSVVVDIRKSTGTYPTFTTSVAGTEKPTVTAAREATDANLTTWTALVAGDVVRPFIESVTDATCANVFITCLES